MRNRLLTGVTVAALAFAAAPASAQVAVPRHPDAAAWDGSRNPAFDEGYRAGEHEGQKDARDGKDYGYKRDDEYEDADRGYLRAFGSRDQYRHEFRRGYEAGYDRGYRAFGFGIHVEAGSAREYGPYGYPERGYGVYAEWGYRPGGLGIAFDFGRRDGYAAGFEAARFGRFEPMRHRYYRSTRGWERRYGARDAWDLNYRNGFRHGYEEGYNDGRRARRRW